MTVVRVTHGRNYEQFLADLPVIHNIGAVVVERGLIDIAGVRPYIRIGRIAWIGEGVEPCLLRWRLSRDANACPFAALIMIVCTESHVVLIMRHNPRRRLQDIIHAIEIIKVEMAVGNAGLAEDIIIHIGIMFRLIGAYTVIHAIGLLFPVDTEVIAPCVFKCFHIYDSAQRSILLQVLRLPISRNCQSFIFANVELDACAHRITLAVVLHGRAVLIVKIRRSLAPAIGEVHIGAAAKIAGRVADTVVVLAAARIDPRALGCETNSPFVRDLRDDVDDAADGIRAIACCTRTADDLDVINVIESDAVDFICRTIIFAQPSRKSAAIDKNEGVTRFCAADADSLAAHVVRSHLDVLFCSERVRECACPLAVKVGAGDDRLRLGRFLEHLFIKVRFHVNIFG